jgi:hypothetical protein
MKAYLVTTGVIFSLMAAVHVWRAIAEWPHSSIGLGFVMGMSALIAIPGVFAWWAFNLLHQLPDKRENDASPKKDSSKSA